MRYLIFSFLTFLSAIQICFSQDSSKSRLCIDVLYQGIEPTFFGAGIGTDKQTEMTLKIATLKSAKKNIYPVGIHQSIYFGRLITPDTLNKIKIARYNYLLNFKFWAIGLGLQNSFMKDFYRLDISPDIGIGYKYIWVLYHRNIKIFDTKRIDLTKNNLTIRLYIPTFKY